MMGGPPPGVAARAAVADPLEADRRAVDLRRACSAP